MSEDRIEAALEGYVTAWQEGAAPEVNEFCRRHLDCGEELRTRIIGFLDQVAPAIRQPSVDRAPVGDAESPRSPYPGLAARGERIGPYKILETIGKGGMGVVYLAEQQQPVRRQVALKLVRLGLDTTEMEVAARFESERQALAVMNHPNIARVYDGGTTEDGRPYFVMEYVKGIPLTTYCDLNRLTTEERLRLFTQVCRGVQHAHQKGVIHRDLKPTNVLVALQDGNPVAKIIDFGVAKATDHRLTEASLYTELGRIIGTAEYMAPEQAGVTSLDIDTRADVYSLGVVLYELLVGSRPFDLAGKVAHAAIQEIREVEPRRPSTRITALDDEQSTKTAQLRRTDIRTLARRLRGDLDWITLKALEKDRTRRYDSAADLAQDIERHFAHEPLLAGPPSQAYRLKKLLRKHRGLVTAVAVILALLVTALSVTLVLVRNLDRALTTKTAAERRERRRAEEASEAQKLAEGRKLELESQVEAYERMADVKRLQDRLREAENELWPAWPENVEPMRAWLAKSKAMRNRLSKHRSQLESLRKLTDPFDRPVEDHPRYQELVQARAEREALDKGTSEGSAKKAEETADENGLEPSPSPSKRLDTRIAELEEIVQGRWEWRFSGEDADEKQWRHDTLAELVEGLEAFTAEDGPLQHMEARLEFAETVYRKTIEEPQDAWEEAIASIADVTECPQYGGREIVRQIGLIPIGRDPDSGLWEFAHYGQTGEVPKRGEDGRLVLTEETGLVFVLLPGGTFMMGSPETEKGRKPDEAPRNEVALDPFFISKYEVTQGQWLRFPALTDNPSTYGPESYGPNWDKLPEDQKELLLHPVETVDWNQCERISRQLGCNLPTEAQWEYAARAGTTTPWASGPDVVSLQGHANLADSYAKKLSPAFALYEESLDDGFAVHAPVGSFTPNAYGLHDMHGNVWEWCRDAYRSYEVPVEPGDGERRLLGGVRSRVLRGGSFNLPSSYARSAFRNGNAPESRRNALGFRPGRRLVAVPPVHHD